MPIFKLDQASREFFNPNNAFDAAGLTILTAEIEERRKRRNEIERDSQVAIQRKNLMAEQQMLELQKEEEYARLPMAAAMTSSSRMAIQARAMSDACRRWQMVTVAPVGASKRSSTG